MVHEVKRQLPNVCFQDISRMESELANLDSQIQMQLESVEAKYEKMNRIRRQIDQVQPTDTDLTVCQHSDHDPNLRYFVCLDGGLGVF